MKKHRWFFMGGGLAWTVVCFLMLACYPKIPGWLLVISVIYPISYLAISLAMNLPARKSGSRGLMV
jgi:hypothetical protein